MGGLLKQLQKSKRRSDSEASEAVVLAEEEVRDYSSVVKPERERPESLDKRIVEAEQIYSDLLQESAVHVREAFGSGTEVMNASVEVPAENSAAANLWVVHGETKPAATKHSEEPTWEVDDRKLPAHIERLIAEAATRLHPRLESLEPMSDLEGAIKEAVESSAEQVISDTRLTWKDHDIAGRELHTLLKGKGPLAPLFEDPAVSEIYVDRFSTVKVMRKGKLVETPLQFRSVPEYSLFVANLLIGTGRSLNFASPIVEGILDDRWQTRFSALHGSVLGADEPRISLRIPRQQTATFYDILQAKVLPATLAAWLAEVVAQGEANLLIVGPAGTGKTLMTSALVSEIGSEARVTTIEDFPEISVPGLNVEKLVARPPGPAGQVGITKTDLLQVAMRRASKRIVVSELKDEEARFYLRALETGFTGSIASIYGEYPEDGLWRLLDLIAAYERAPQQSLVRRIARCFHLVIAMEQVEGKPCVSELGEVYPGNGSEFIVQPLVRFDGVVDGKRIWKIIADDSYWIRRTAEKGVGLKSGPALLPLDKSEAASPNSKKK